MSVARRVLSRISLRRCGSNLTSRLRIVTAVWRRPSLAATTKPWPITQRQSSRIQTRPIATSAGALYLAMGEYQKAIDDFSRQLEFRTDAMTYSRRGEAYEALRELQRALSDFQAAEQLDPKLESAREGLARLANVKPPQQCKQMTGGGKRNCLRAHIPSSPTR